MGLQPGDHREASLSARKQALLNMMIYLLKVVIFQTLHNQKVQYAKALAI